jgi:hypothetical protein
MSLKDIIEAQVKGMPFEAVDDLLNEEMAAISKLEKEVRSTLAQGASLDSNTVVKAGDTLKRKKLFVSALQKRRNELRRQHHSGGHISLERAFMTTAKRRLNPHTYAEILNEAKCIVEDDKKG